MLDAGILEQVLWHIHNWFVRETIPVRGCAIENGSLPASVSSKMLDGMWYRIEGSYLNDGLHQYRETYPQGQTSDLVDETFSGAVSLLAIPKALLLVVEDIGAWQMANGDTVDGPYASESFGGYTYSLRSDSSANAGGGGLSGWRLAFRDRLNPWRKIA